MAVVKEELEGSPKITWTRSGGTATQMFRINWQDQDQFMREIFPSAFVSGTSIIIPKALSFPNKYWLIAKSAAIEPFVPDAPSGFGEIPNYYPGGAKVTIQYETPQYDQSDQGNDGPGGATVFVKHTVGVTGEFLTYPSQSLSWEKPADSTLDAATAGPSEFAVSEDMQTAVVIPMLDHKMNWPHVAYPPWLAIRQCVGKVNAYAFAGAPPETLLFTGADGEREITNEGIRAWNLTYKANEKNQNAQDPLTPQGWNHFLRPTGAQAGTFQRLKKKLSRGGTLLTFSILSASTALTVNNASGFPKGAPFWVTIKGGGVSEKVKVNTTDGRTEWTTATPITNSFSVGATITQYLGSTISGCSKTATTVAVADRSPFPQVGQFLIQTQGLFDGEVMAVIGGHGQGAGDFNVLRGVQGTSAKAFGGGEILAVPGNVYDIADFRVLFLSGLITG